MILACSLSALQIGTRGSTQVPEHPAYVAHICSYTQISLCMRVRKRVSAICAYMSFWARRVCDTHVRIYECTSTHVCTLSHCIMDACTCAHKIRRATSCARIFLGKLHSITLCSNLCISIVKTLYCGAYICALQRILESVTEKEIKKLLLHFKNSNLINKRE